MGAQTERIRSIGSLVGRHRALAAAVVLSALVAAAFIVFYFEPHKLVIDHKVDEAAPGLEAGAPPAPASVAPIAE